MSPLNLLPIVHLSLRNTRVTYSWQQDWHSCGLDCPHCWRPCSCRIPHLLVWRHAKSGLPLEPGRWVEEGQGSASMSRWAGGSQRSPHRLKAHPDQDPLPRCRWLTAGSLEELRRGEMQKWVERKLCTAFSAFQLHIPANNRSYKYWKCVITA